MRILIVEDESKMARLIARALGEAGMVADVAKRGEDALVMAKSTEYDAILLDLGLPGIDGFETCRRLRADGVWAPVLVLTARDAVDDRVAGLDSGADDYLTKPFAIVELLARIRALTRRGRIERPAVLEVGELRLDPASRRAWRGEEEISLSSKEFGLLQALMRRPGEVLSREQLLEQVWGDNGETQSNVVDVYVYYLRQKVDRPFDADSVETVRGGGYRLRQDR
jgi:two-component system OmpR family response regulator